MDIIRFIIEGKVMPKEIEPVVNSPRRTEHIGRYSAGLFVILADGRRIRRPTTMLRPPTYREAMLGRPATSLDIIGAEALIHEADELKELNKHVEHSYTEEYDS